ncbi:hypothetical protein J4526_09000 [Desulfurococcaceae archaeon MEX13E-LK6-19]|nr:hypothetical protein J4526_09000 [Desulfurococcaceae archaeon MEX13E-LK6-19]
MMYYAHVINMLCILYLLTIEMLQNSVYTLSPSLFLVLPLLIHPAPLMLVFITLGYLAFKAAIRGVIKYKWLFIIWRLGPLLYIATLAVLLVIVIIKVIISPFPTKTYHYFFPPQLGLIIFFFYYAVPGPFISLATLPEYIQYMEQYRQFKTRTQNE